MCVRSPVCCARSVHFKPSLPSVPRACTVFRTFARDVNPSSLAASSGSRGLAPVARAITSLLLVLYLVWGFPLPGPAGELECPRVSLGGSLSPGGGGGLCFTVPGVIPHSSGNNFRSDERFLF